jgi:hypothetical protein
MENHTGSSRLTTSASGRPGSAADQERRSALIREALEEHLRRLEISDREERDRAGYAKQSQAIDESLAWEAEAAWPQ